MKRFLIFAGESYYPSGGWDDFDTFQDNYLSAKDRAHHLIYNGQKDWVQVIDTEEMIQFDFSWQKDFNNFEPITTNLKYEDS